ncbi:hypothetical protein CROQUDRAFT_655421 [Cronartium quercuum f. sp. fusiforme G11]|uniref:Secreted protein n=1 Tax=Cronartium quercuum f. sp. fusiforme G11 TaxID=708437 RepID=A0A9P6TDT7_9BASI|nr:hypothetical protein CROQUDRAFT_655421 [Cronartium quercuum f. sp. fusiforme G11]
MHRSIPFVLAALAVTVMASPDPVANVPRHLEHTRFVRRSPKELTMQMKDEQDVKCGFCAGGTTSSSVIYGSSFSFMSQFSNVGAFAGSGAFPVLANSFAATSISSWTLATQAIVSVTNAASVFTQYIQTLQAVSINILLTSFRNLFSTVAVIVTQIQALGPFAGFGQFVNVYTQLIVYAQGLFLYISQTVGIQQFIGACGPFWQTFLATFTSLIQIGVQGQIFTSAFFASSGINTSFFQSIGITAFQQQQISISQISTVSAGAWASALPSTTFDGLPVGGFPSAFTFGSTTFEQHSSSSQTSVSGGAIAGQSFQQSQSTEVSQGQFSGAGFGHHF